MELPKSSQRVAQHSPADANEQIERATQWSIDYYSAHQDEIPARLEELDREWDIERLLQTNASALMLAGIGLGFGVNKKFFALPLAVSGFLLQHALQGWCPPVSLLRRIGKRTQAEIEGERAALERILQGVH